MKYGALNKAVLKQQHISGFNGGINLSGLPESLEKFELSECENMVFSDGVLKTRSGISADENNLLRGHTLTDVSGRSFELHNTEFLIDGIVYRVASELIFYDESHCFCYVYFVGADGSLKSGSYIHFQRVSDDTFYVPQKFLFYRGKPTEGAGLYCMLTLSNTSGKGTENRIYELKSGLDGWDMVYSYYIPVVYINGRGNGYEAAKESNQASTGVPTLLEEPNILNGTFYAYYSSDGYSSSFRLPFSNIDNSSVICRIHYSLTTYTEWIIAANETSKKQTFFGTEVTMHINRQKGVIYFTVESGDYNIPLMSTYRENNIRILASKTSELSFGDVVSSQTVVSNSGKIAFSNKNRLFVCDFDNPLYFRTNATVKISDDDSITAMAPYKDKIVVFKQNEIICVKIKKGEAVNSISLLTDNDKVFYKSDSFEVSYISNYAGCNDNSLVTVNSGQIFWLSSDGKIYTLSSALNKVICLSEKIEEVLSKYLAQYDSGCAFSFGNNCAFTFDNISVIMNLEKGYINSDKNVSFYLWSFPEDMRFLGCFANTTETVFICRNIAGDLCYTAKFRPGADKILSGNTFSFRTVEHSIKSFLKTKSFDFGCVNTLKKIESVILNISSASGIEIGINNRLEANIKCLDYGSNYRIVKLTPALCGVDSVYITLKSESEMALKELDINYVELTN